MSIIPEIKPQQSIELLKELHILTRDGKINQDTRRKLKQIYHLYQFIEPLMQEILSQRNGQLTLVDHGAGKSYLGFLLVDLLLKEFSQAQVIGIESRAELVQKSSALAHKLKFSQMQFYAMSVKEAITSTSIPSKVDIVTALHACDTATDDAIAFALAKKAQHIVIVPCCQAEVARVLKQNKARMLAQTSLSQLWRHPLHSRELGSHLTNVLRCLQLEANGYKVNVTELVGWEHSMKNELIIATKVANVNHQARSKQLELIQQFGLEQLQTRFTYCENTHE